VQPERAELVAEPERAVAVALHRFDVEVGAGQDPVAAEPVDDRERDLVARVAELEEVLDGDRARAATGGLEPGLDQVDAQVEVPETGPGAKVRVGSTARARSRVCPEEEWA